MGQWRVDPDGVLGVLAGIDDLGPQFESAYTGIDDAATNGRAALTADGRTVLSSAWEAFMSQRRLVPGKLMHSVSGSAAAVGEATVAIVAGDEQMADNVSTAEKHAEDAWGIAPYAAYVTDGSYR
ncbi:hypothetical protein GCM10027421_01520 [Microbacterium shaanxiense]